MTTLVTSKDREEELMAATRPTTPEEIKHFIQDICLVQRARRGVVSDE